MDTFAVNKIGVLRAGEDGFRVELLPAYAPALVGVVVSEIKT